VTSANVLSSVHVYHSMWPLMGSHAVRPPILPGRTAIALPDVVGRYHESLTRGDVEGTVEQFAADGAVRESDGDQHIHRGSSALTAFFGRVLVHGGITLEGCSLTDDGTSCALEYNVTAWGGVVLPHQAGIAVYERAGTRLLAAARIYDDVEMPSFAA
jgi:hypothetical protein